MPDVAAKHVCVAGDSGGKPKRATRQDRFAEIELLPCPAGPTPYHDGTKFRLSQPVERHGQPNP
jgi:hypothetical protein